MNLELRHYFIIPFILAFFFSKIATGNESTDTGSDQSNLLSLSLEELMNVEVTTVSKRPQRLTEVASAVFVITKTISNDPAQQASLKRYVWHPACMLHE